MVTLEDFKLELSPEQYDINTQGSDATGQRCLDKARTWLTAKVRPLKVVVDESDPVVREILLKRATYELYAFAQVEGMAKDRRLAAMELARAVYGPGFDGEGYDNAQPRQGSAVATVVKGPENKMGVL